MIQTIKPSLPVLRAWVTFRSQIIRAQGLAIKARYLFDCGPDLRHKANKMHRAGRELERKAVVAMMNVLRTEYNRRFRVERRKNDEEWIVTTWPPYKRDESASFRLYKSMKLPVSNPRTFESILANAKKGV